MIMDSTSEQIRDLEDDLVYLRREIADGLLEPTLGRECIQAYEDRIAWKRDVLAKERRSQLKVLRRRPRRGMMVSIARWTKPFRTRLGLL